MPTVQDNISLQPIRPCRDPWQSLWVVVVLVALLSTAGCLSITGRGAVSQSVADCRHYTQQGIAALEEGNSAEARSLLSRAVESCPIDVDARRHYGEALWRQGTRRAAVAQIEQAIGLNRHDSALPVRAGEMYLALGELTKAGRKADDVLRIDPTHAAGWALRARIGVADGRPADALADFHRALGYSPDEPQLLLELADLYNRAGEPQRALSTLQQLVDTYPPDDVPRRVYSAQGLALASLGRFDDAADSHRAAARRGPADAEILYRLAQAEMLAHRPQAARWAARDALAIEPRHSPSQQLLERIELAGRSAQRRGL